MPSTDPDRPNVIVILTDDQGYWAMGCAGNEELRTPNLDHLAATGIRFENFFCVSPVCSPARASLLTGRIPSQHGVHDWLSAGNSTCEPERDGELTEYLAGQTAYTDLLAGAGYVCGMSGKWHLGDAHHPQKSFTYWNVHARAGGSYYEAPMVADEERVYLEPRYITDVFTDNALGFLDAQTGGEAPFYLSLHYTAPHSPWSRKNHPPKVFESYYEDCPFESVPDEPMHPWARPNREFFSGPEKRREYLSGYFAAVEAMDANVGRVLDWLERHRLRENTLIFFTSDNGMNMGHHGICGKGNGTRPMNMFETSVKVPALVSRPGHLPEGMVSDGLFSHYDFMPTLLDYVGVPNPEADALPGRSFAPLLRGEDQPGREDVVVFDEYGPVRMIRTPRWKYVHRHPNGPHELYDLSEDPDERSDLYGRPEHRPLIDELHARMDGWFDRYVVPELDGNTLPVTGFGQVGRAREHHKGGEPFSKDFPGGWWREPMSLWLKEE
ncbi:MAG: sulfatase-like hydrolase/transferase [Candidatus Brocadiia bacterium]